MVRVRELDEPRAAHAASLLSCDQYLKRRSAAPLDLLHAALAWGFIWPPAQELRAVAKAAAGEVIVFDFDYEFRLERFPFCRTFGAPAAGAAGGFSCEAWRVDQLF